MDVYQHICPVRLSDRHGEPLNPLKGPLLPRTLDCFGRFSSKAAFPKTVCPCYRCRCGLGRMRLFFSPYPLHWTADTRTYVPAICDLCPMKGIRLRKPKTWCDFVLQVRTIDSLRGPLAAFFLAGTSQGWVRSFTLCPWTRCHPPNMAGKSANCAQLAM